MGDMKLSFNEFFFLTNQRLGVIKNKIIEQHGLVEEITLTIDGKTYKKEDDIRYLYEVFGVPKSADSTDKNSTDKK